MNVNEITVKKKETNELVTRIFEDEEGIKEITSDDYIVEVKENGWIPVEERLPKQAGYACLATIQNKFGQIKIAKVFTHYGTGTFWLCNESDIDLNVWEVIAWMLLPEPYQGEEK